MRVIYVNPMTYGTNPGVDAIAHGLDHHLRQAGIELRVIFAHFADPGWLEKQEDAIDAGIEAGVDGIILYILDPSEPAAAVARARRAGIPVITFERPRFPVEGSLVYPNFNQGTYMAEELAGMLAPAATGGARSGAEVAVIGGPKIVDDDELVDGIVNGVRRSGLRLLNDPTRDEYRNESDVRPGGREVALRVLTEFPHLDGLIPFNDETMLGALDAIDEVGRRGEMKLVSRNGTPKAVQALHEGRTHGTWDIDCPKIGSALGDLVVKALSGGADMEGELALGPIGRMITLENVDRWKPWNERVPFEQLREGLS
jgi:ABC-type sugar transport system substrate-binding protein